ncbi:MAG: hypothetical protein U9O98_10655 [Asgard group archaeon]|nr:hypothetical protein [Asgard group archaeon]
MPKKSSLSKKISNKITEKGSPSRSELLRIVTKTFVNHAKLKSCTFADSNGLILAEENSSLLPDEKMSAASALAIEFCNRFGDLFEMRNMSYTYLHSPNTHVWIKTISLRDTGEKFILLISKRASFMDHLSRNFLRLLGRKRKHIPDLLNEASIWLKDIMEE